MKTVRKDPRSLPQVKNEAEILSHLRHPGIPALYDVTEDDSFVCLIEEYAAGTPLGKYLTEHSPGRREIIGILTGVCDILSALHEDPGGPILYLDLKPEHIILSGETVSLIDYGTARISQSARPGKNPFDIRYGTGKYCPPEVSGNGDLDVRSDIYSLGILAGELYSRSAEPPSIRVASVIGQATERDAVKRPESVRQWKEAFLRAAALSERKEGRLFEKAAVMGASPGCGTTHVAIALTVYLNRTGRTAFYMNRSADPVTRYLTENDRAFRMRSDGMIYHAGFAAFPDRGPAAEKLPPCRGIQVIDCGTDQEKGYDADVIIHVISSCPWKSMTLPDDRRLGRDTAIILNPGVRGRGIEMSRFFGQKVFGFPSNDDCFIMTKEKKRFFDSLMGGL